MLISRSKRPQIPCTCSTAPLDAPDNLCSFSIQLCGVSIVGFLLAVFQTITFVVLQQAVLATVVPVAESAVADDSLRPFPAVLVGAPDLLRWHAASKRHGEVERGLSVDVVVCERT